MVKEFGGNKYLRMSKGMSTIEVIEDVGAVFKPDTSVVSAGGELQNAGVPEFLLKKVCRRCKGYVEPGSGIPPTFGRCLRPDCGMVQRYELCATRLVSKLMFAVDRGSEVILSAYGNVIRDLVGVADNDDVEELALVNLPTFEKVTFNGHDVITAFEFKGTHQETSV